MMRCYRFDHSAVSQSKWTKDTLDFQGLNMVAFEFGIQVQRYRRNKIASHNTWNTSVWNDTVDRLYYLFFEESWLWVNLACKWLPHIL